MKPDDLRRLLDHLAGKHAPTLAMMERAAIRGVSRALRAFSAHLLWHAHALERLGQHLARREEQDGVLESSPPSVQRSARVVSVLDLAAVHEAGHVVAATVLGVKVRSVAVTVRGDPGAPLGFSDCDGADARVDAVVCLAGIVATGRAFPSCPDIGSDTDWRTYEDLARRQADPEVWKTAREAEAMDTIYSHWPAVERVAAALLERETLTGAEVRALVQGQAAAPAGAP